MVVINVRRSTMVRPAEATPQRRLWLSNLDLVMLNHYTLSVHFYRPDGSANFFDAAVLRDALARVLVPFYPMAGRLACGEDDRIVIDCNGDGALFVEADAEATVDDFGDFAPTVELEQLFPKPNADYTDDISAFPLFLIQVTHLKCGGVSLGTGVHHQVVDGLAGLHLINSWSDVARGVGITVQPFIDRTLLRSRDPPNPSFPHIEYQPPPSMNSSVAQVPSSAVAVRIFKLTREQLDLLKAKAPPDGSYSTHVLLAAHLWRCACIARDLPPDQMTKMYIPTDGRQRIQPPLPQGYFGNVIFRAAPVATAGEVTSPEGGPSPAAKTIQGAVLRMDATYLQSALDYLEIRSNMLAQKVNGATPFGCPNLWLTSWARLPIHDADFGWGRPIFMGPSPIRVEGVVIILPSAAGDGGLSVAISLQPDHMVKFQDLIYDI
ncbi:hydroxycinnamoyltransferase-like [Zingiber officinale]|uniref:Uncharacterized protein n=1 Tax=Zingiber officinale TaxID=94328 RepID=A0A8J5H1P4_ZINOF|nr:hydroxycinnamoyltransferase-like [Zingiber officinale]XP_042374586.1 hydroxycinnamoyltransferase-like [Zingiber officinale]KAG6517988.1 hypothetical protein ZIOFF_021388 [Zingiber officinale]KAG6517989.1 hypothetical protein ZIOFF_021389 [Zingiber officinale]